VCGRYSVSVEPALVAERFQLELPEGVERRWNVAPSQPVLAVLTNREGTETRAKMVRWGLIPHWAKDEKAGFKMINARAEGLLDSGSYRPLLDHRRCLIPADGFYEWRRDPDGAKRPVRYTVDGGAIFAFAGLWTVWHDPRSGERVRSCTIVTTEANSLVAAAHDRMPVILPREAEATWLSHEVGAGEALQLLLPLPPERMQAADVSTLLGNPDNEGPELLDPLTGTDGSEQLSLI
jgi:putative SOS response-associated peptidase YedK